MQSEGSVTLGFDPSWTERLVSLYALAGMGTKDPSMLSEAFAQSFAVATVWQDGELCGAGRVVSDGVYYASIFDVAVRPDKQRKGIGSQIMAALESTVPSCLIYLTSTFGNEEFYSTLGYRRHKTAFAKYPFASPYLEEL